jgi:hypothetical protein
MRKLFIALLICVGLMIGSGFYFTMSYWLGVFHAIIIIVVVIILISMIDCSIDKDAIS